MGNRVATCLRLASIRFFALSYAVAVSAQETILTPTEPWAVPASARTDDAYADDEFQKWAFHAQTTLVYQYHPSFPSPYQGPNSLNPSAEGKETFDLTLYGGVRLWRGAELWITPEVDQGHGLSDTFGVAGFPSGAAYKLGSTQPYGRVHRAYVRQTISLDGEIGHVDPDLMQLAGPQPANRVVLT